MDPTVFCKLINPIPTGGWGGGLCPPHYYCTSPGFLNGASHSFNFFHSDTGNKEVMDGVQIIENYLYGVTETKEGGNLIVDSTPNEPLTVYADDYTECMEECKDRY